MTDLPVYLDALGAEHRNPWVCVVFFQDHQYDDPHLEHLMEVDWSNAHAIADVQAIADYLAHWDYGDETDGAHTSSQDPHTTDRFAVVHYVTIAEGHDYVLTVNRALGTVGLYRRPLDWAEGEFAS